MVAGSLKNPHAVVVGALTVVLLGVVAATRIPTDILPTFKTPAVQVLTLYPGMPAEVMEKDITSRLERWTGQANGISHQEARSMNGVSIVRDYFRPDIDPNTAMSQVSSLAIADMYYLPPGTVPPMIMPFDPTASMPLCLVSVSSPSHDETQLYDIAYFELRNRLQGISGVIAPAVYGGRIRRILAYVDRDKLAVRNLSPMDVVSTLKNFNTFIPTGNAKIGEFDYQINANGMVRHVEQMNEFPVRVGKGGAPIQIRDVGKVEDTHQIQTNVVRVNGRRQVYIPIYRQPGANTIAVVDGIKETIGSILERLPKGVNLDVVLDQSVYVRKAIASLEKEALAGAALAGLMIWLFIGSLRYTFVILLSVPLSILAAIAGLYFTGDSLKCDDARRAGIGRWTCRRRLDRRARKHAPAHRNGEGPGPGGARGGRPGAHAHLGGDGRDDCRVRTGRVPDGDRKVSVPATGGERQLRDGRLARCRGDTGARLLCQVYAKGRREG